MAARDSFKYLSAHYGVEQIIPYGADAEKDPRKVLNPKRKALKQKLQAVSQEVEALEAELGRALDQNEETKHRTARGLKIKKTVAFDVAWRKGGKS